MYDFFKATCKYNKKCFAVLTSEDLRILVLFFFFGGKEIVNIMDTKPRGFFVIIFDFVLFSLCINDVNGGKLGSGKNFGYGNPPSIWDEERKINIPLWARLLIAFSGIAVLALIIFCYCKCRRRSSDAGEATEADNT